MFRTHQERNISGIQEMRNHSLAHHCAENTQHLFIAEEVRNTSRLISISQLIFLFKTLLINTITRAAFVIIEWVDCMNKPAQSQKAQPRKKKKTKKKGPELHTVSIHNASQSRVWIPMG